MLVFTSGSLRFFLQSVLIACVLSQVYDFSFEMRAPVSVLISGVFSLKIKLEYLERLSFCRHQNWVAIPELIRFKLSPTLTEFQREGEKTLAVKFSKKLKVQKRVSWLRSSWNTGRIFSSTVKNYNFSSTT